MATKHATDSAAATRAETRRLRKQVSRACDWCRARKIRCDNGQPCKACQHRNAECTHSGVDEPRTLPQALREIDRLRDRVKELEAELAGYKDNACMSIPTPGHSSSSTSPVSSLQSQAAHSPQTSSPKPPPMWEGIHVATTHIEQKSYYGPASAHYFISRIGCYLRKALQEPLLDRNLQPRALSRNIYHEIGHDNGHDDGQDDGLGAMSMAKRGALEMNRQQEESLLRLFWEGYHCLIPIVDEADFRAHYASLWSAGKPWRKSSPLVDIILALCLQYGYAYIPQRTRCAGDAAGSGAPIEDATVAGRWYFRRAQALLAEELENPSLMTVQSYIISASYLCCASFINMCHIILAQNMRIAQVLGLHLEPPADMPQGERELRKRVWWALWILDAKSSTKLGRPLLIDASKMTVSLPTASDEAARFNGAAFGSYGEGINWLTYFTGYVKLGMVVADMHNRLFAAFGDVMGRNSLSSPYNDPEVLEACAKNLSPSLAAATKAWIDELPAELKMQRLGGGASQPYSASRAALELDAVAPVWLQRQRACLELTFHHYLINITRPFISFYAQPGTHTPEADRQAAACADHAVAFTGIMHQLVTETDLLSGWSELFGMQWNAGITAVGFLLAYPIHPAAGRVRKAVDKAVAVFALYGETFAVSADAATIMRDMVAKVDLLSERLGSGLVASAGGGGGTDAAAEEEGGGDAENDDGLAWLDPSRQEDPAQFNDFMDWALSVDSFNSFERMWDFGWPVDTT